MCRLRLITARFMGGLWKRLLRLNCMVCIFLLSPNTGLQLLMKQASSWSDVVPREQLVR